MKQAMFQTLLPAALLAAGVHGAFAAVPADEAKQLGTTLTPWGAEIAGNKDGTIPAYTGGLSTPPASYDKSKPAWRPDPFVAEKALYRIDAKNAAQYKERLTPGTMAMFQKYPDTFFIDVYPTHRSAAYPKDWLDNSVKNATRCKLINDGNGIDTSNGCGGGAVFPLPKTGLEVMWNKESTYRGPGAIRIGLKGRYIKPNGELILTSALNMATHFALADPQSNHDRTYQYRIEWSGPTRLAGSTSVLIDNANNLDRRAWNYQPSSRRVRLAPDFAADTPMSSSGGSLVYDDDGLFSGKRDRYDWTLVGKKEVYLPYNNYRLSYPDPSGGCTEKVAFTAHHPKSECIRWELHRVWQVRATLKKDKRHVYHMRDFFMDEDIQSAGIAENYDQGGKLWRVNMIAAIPSYEALAPGYGEQLTFDLITGMYFNINVGTGVRITPFDPSVVNPDGMATHVLR